MVLRSKLLANTPRLESAASNAPPMRKGERGDAVAKLQQALLSRGLNMPITTCNGTRPADGIYGDETVKAVAKFQMQEQLSCDGIAGRDTLTRLDQLLASGDNGEPLPVVRRGDFAMTTARKTLPKGK